MLAFGFIERQADCLLVWARKVRFAVRLTEFRLRSASQRPIVAALSDPATGNVVWTEGEPVEPVTPENPLVGLEALVLKTWLENSSRLRQAYRVSLANRRDIENAVRLRVADALDQEVVLRAQSMTLEEAQSLTRPAMWTPPRW